MKTSRRPPVIGFLLLSFILLGLHVHAAVSIYSFENLNLGNVAGQDGWIDSPNNPDGAVSFIISTGTGADTSKVFGTAGSPASNFAWRPNDGNFSFGDLSSSPVLILGFDGQFVGNSFDQIHFNLRNTANTAASPIFGYEGNNFRIGGNFAALPGTINANDWVRMQMVMDMTLGTASLYYQNLTDSETSFTPVSGLQNVSTGTLNPAVWNEMLLRTGFNAGNKIDNLYIETSSSVPETSRALLAALGLVGLILRRRR